jgi:hypothetical protein
MHCALGRVGMKMCICANLIKIEGFIVATLHHKCPIKAIYSRGIFFGMCQFLTLLFTSSSSHMMLLMPMHENVLIYFSFICIIFSVIMCYNHVEYVF